MSKIKGNKGFTVGELLIVIAIIGILTALALPTFLVVIPKVKTHFAKQDAQILVLKVNEFYSGNANYGDEFDFYPFKKSQRIAVGWVNSGFYTHRDENGDIVTDVFAVSQAFVNTDNAWPCGSYNPDTNKWENEYNDNTVYVYKGVRCSSAGEYFIRAIYDYGADIPSEEIVFPQDKDGYEWYISFEPRVFDGESEESASTRVPVGTLYIKSSNPSLSDLVYTFEVR